MYSIKQKIIIKISIYNIISNIKKSSSKAYKFGNEMSLLYYFLNEGNNLENNINVNILNFLKNFDSDKKLNSLIYNNFPPLVDYEKLLKKLHLKILKIKDLKILKSYFHGYYFGTLDIFGSNINKSYVDNTLILNFKYYFVLYDYHTLYLKFILKQIESLTDIPCKIKFLIKYEYDKYSINELTDDINFKLVFIHKKKYYNNSIYLLLDYLFNGFDENYIIDNQLEYPHSIYLLLSE